MLALDPLTLLALSACMGVLAAYAAFRQGKNPYFWFLIGAVFGFFGIYALFFVPSKRKFHHKTNLHTQPVEQIIIGPTDKFWYYLNALHEQVGPMSFQALNKAWKDGTINKKTLVWHEDLSDWKSLEEYIRFKRVF